MGWDADRICAYCNLKMILLAQKAARTAAPKTSGKGVQCSELREMEKPYPDPPERRSHEDKRDVSCFWRCGPPFLTAPKICGRPIRRPVIGARSGHIEPVILRHGRACPRLSPPSTSSSLKAPQKAVAPPAH